jgi:glycosyltransferase involved in cell wall biosynthesis
MEHKKFVIIIPSYNNAKWYEKNVLSAVGQDYPDDRYRIIYKNDCSTDGTGDLVGNLIAKNGWKNIELINNEDRRGALHNIYDMMNSCGDDEIGVDLDADDLLANSQVLNRLNKEYQNPDVWMTWGSYLDSSNMSRGCCKPYEQSVIDRNAYNAVSWRASHCRTRRASLFKKIKKEDLMYQGKFFSSGWDLGYQIPLLSLSAGRFSYIHDILYIYNNDNPISDYKVRAQEQAFFDRYIRAKKPYEKLDKL